MSIKKNIIYNTVLRVLNVAFPVITTPYVSRILGVENIGIVNFTITYASYFVLFASLGIPLYGVREIAKNSTEESSNKVFTEIFIISCLSTLLFSLIYVISIFQVPALARNKEFLLVAGISVLFVPVNVDWFFAGKEQFKMLTVRSIIAKILSIGGLFLLVHKRDDILPYMVLIVIANLISQWWSFGYLLKHGVKLVFKSLQLKVHIKPIFILFFSSVAVSIYTMLAPILLGFMSSYIEVGFYTSANKVSSMILPIVTSMSLVIVARINTLKGSADYNEQVSRLLIRSFDYMLMLAIPATVGLILVAPRFVPLFFGAEFIPATVSLQLMSLLIIIIGLSNLFGTQVLVALGHEKKYLKAILFGTVINFTLNMFLIGKYGALGASLASVAAEILVMIATAVYALKVVSVNFSLKNMYQPLLASMLFIPISWVLNRIIENDFNYVVSTGIVCSILYVFIMLFAFKHEQASQAFEMIASKAKKIF